MRGGCQGTDEGEECQQKKVWKVESLKSGKFGKWKVWKVEHCKEVQFGKLCT